jgi:hypothetical protein
MVQPTAESQEPPTESDTNTVTEDKAAQYILERTSLVYFFANQVPLLELANMEGSNAVGSVPHDNDETLSTQLMNWKNLRLTFGKGSDGTEASAARPRQIVALSDPSDLLSWRVPGIEGLVIANLYVHNTWWHWLIASPTAAHGNYDKNKSVLRIMLGSKTRHLTD